LLQALLLQLLLLLLPLLKEADEEAISKEK